MSRRERILQSSRRAERVERDRLLVAPLYSRLCFVERDGIAEVEGSVTIYDGAGPPEEISILIVFPTDYPEYEPRIYEVGNRFQHTADRHFVKDDVRDCRCCLWHTLTTRWDEHEPEGILRFLEEALVFFRRQLICDVTGTYPGPAFRHAHAGTLEALSEVFGNELLARRFRNVLLMRPGFGMNGPCPCGKTRKLSNCHGPVVERIRTRISQKHLRAVFAWVSENSGAHDRRVAPHFDPKLAQLSSARSDVGEAESHSASAFSKVSRPST